MKLAPVLLALPLWFVLAQPSAPPSPSTSPQTTPTAAASPSPSPSPSPIPTSAFLSLDVTQGDASTVINVSGGQFFAGQQMTLYWDTPSHVAGSATADGSGNVNTRVKPFAGDKPGLHKLCASVAPNPCADFTLEAVASPTPSASPSPTESPSPSPSPSASAVPTASPTPVATTLSAFDVITRPPFVFLPIVGVMAILVSLAYWVFSVVRRPAAPSLPAAAVVHRATRPDYSAGFGAAPAAPTPPAPEPSAWADYVPKTPYRPPADAPPADVAPAPPPGPPPELPAPPATAWGELPPPASPSSLPPAEPDEPPELPEPGE